MSDEELDNYVREMRAVMESPQALRKAVSRSGGRSKKKPSTEKQTAKIDINQLLDL